VRRQPAPVVGDAEIHMVVVPAEVDRDRGGSVALGVLHDVADHPA